MNNKENTMEELVINATLRKDFGKQKVRVIRNNKEVPAVIYSKNHDTIHISIPVEELKKVLKTGSNELIKINIKNNGESSQKIALLKELQRHVTTDELLHVDLYEVFENQYIKTKAPVLVTGKAKGLELGGILQVVARELSIKCLPTAIPKHIEIDVTELNIGHTLHVKNIKPIKGVEFIDNPEAPVVHVMVPAKEEVVQPVAAAPEATAAEPEVIKKGKEAKEGEQPAEETKDTKQAAPAAKEKAEPKKEAKKESKSK
jgi:large subunit ribosomal protein L25